MVKAVSIWLFAASLLSSLANAATTARFNRDTIRLNETVELIIESDQSAISGEVDLDALEQDFRFINRRRDTNVTILNGKSQLVHRWRALLAPVSVGSFSVGPIKVGSDETNRLRLTVLPEAEESDAEKEVFIELEIDKDTVYVQQQILLTANLFVSARLMDGSLADPTPANTIVRRLGKDVRYESTRGGKSYAVYQRIFALIPQQSGELVIPALQFEGLVDDPNAGSSGIFNPLFSQGRRIVANTKTIKVKVKPPAEEFQGKTWLPADEVSISEESSDNPELVVGQPITRKIRLTGVNVTAEQLPEPEIAEVVGIKSYPDQNRLKTEDTKAGVIGSLSIDIAMIGSVAGEITLPEIVVPWWNTSTDQMETAVLPSRVVRVVENTSAADNNINDNSGALNNTALNEPTIVDAPTQPDNAKIDDSQVWKWFAIIMAGVWFLTLGVLFWVYRSRTEQYHHKKPELKAPNLAECYERIQKACREDDPVSARSALLDWGRLHLGRPVLLQQLGELVKSKEVKAVAFKKELALLDEALFSHGGGEMWRLFEYGSAVPLAQKGPSGEELPSLYPKRSFVK